MKRFALSCLLISACIATAAAQEQSATRVYIMSEVCTPETLNQRVYPQRAIERSAMGDGTIDCTLNEEHQPITCQIVAESSPGWGWGDAAVHASCRMEPRSWGNPRGSNARNYTDDAGVVHARRTVRFQVEGGWRPESR